MTRRDPHTPLTEATPEGEQTLIPGVSPITMRDRLDLLADAPLRSRAAQKPIDIGLFDEASRNQLDLFDKEPCHDPDYR